MLFLYLSIIMSYLRHALFHRDLILVGAECHMSQADKDEKVLLISFAPVPVDKSSFDDYGWSDETDMHLPKVSHLIGFLRQARRLGGDRPVKTSLLYASLLE